MRPRIRLGRLLAALLAVVTGISGCGSASVPSGQSPGASTLPSLPPHTSARGSASPLNAPSGNAPTRDASAGSVLLVDPRLLTVLPAQVDGVALEPDPTTAAQIAADSTLAGSAEAIAVALAISPGTSAGDDLAIASVIRLRPGVFGDAWFQEWRTTYDAAACDVAGGVGGLPSQIQIGGRTVYVGTCAGDAHTYHVHLADPSLIVSITSAGPRDLGKLVVAGIAE